jgi:hypothetical protein
VVANNLLRPHLLLFITNTTYMDILKIQVVLEGSIAGKTPSLKGGVISC